LAVRFVFDEENSIVVVAITHEFFLIASRHKQLTP
jgi:hypothetical protein